MMSTAVLPRSTSADAGNPVVWSPEEVQDHGGSMEGDFHEDYGRNHAHILRQVEETGRNIVVFQVKTREELEQVLKIQWDFNRRGIKVHVRTNNQSIAKLLQVGGEVDARTTRTIGPNIQIIGNKPDFLATHPNQDANGKDPVPHIEKCKNISPSIVDISRIMQLLAEGRAAHLRIENLDAMDDRTLQALFRIKQTYKEKFVLDVQAEKSESKKSQVMERWKKAEQQVKKEVVMRTTTRTRLQGTGVQIPTSPLGAEPTVRPGGWLKKKFSGAMSGVKGFFGRGKEAA